LTLPPSEITVVAIMPVLIATDTPVTYACGAIYLILRLGPQLRKRGDGVMIISPSRAFHMTSRRHPPEENESNLAG
jgi:hypothetical protein